MDEKQLEAVIKLDLNEREVLFENNTFDFVGLWVPTKSKRLSRGLGYKPWSLMLDFQNLEFYRMAICDNSIPNNCLGLEMFVDILFGRIHMIQALGDLKYRLACPELREAMLYDLNEEIRDVAAYSLGKMEDKKFIPDFIRVIKKPEEKKHVRERAYKALSKIGDSKASLILRDRYEELILEIKQKEKQEWDLKDGPWGCFKYQHELLELRHLLEAMFDIGDQLAEDTYWKTKRNPNPAVLHELKNAVFGSKYYEKVYGRKRLITNPHQIQKELQNIENNLN